MALPVVTKRDLFAKVSRPRFPKIEALDRALEVLESHNMIRWLPTDERSRPGRKPSRAFEVHPDLLPQKPQNLHNQALEVDSAESAVSAAELPAETDEVVL
jgi:hypothetical protein